MRNKCTVRFLVTTGQKPARSGLECSQLGVRLSRFVGGRRSIKRHRRQAGNGETPDQRVGFAAARDWSVLSLAELSRCGLSRDAVERRARRGTLYRIHHGVYAVGHPNPPLEGRFLAAVKACGRGAALSHFAATAHWGMLDWDGRHIDVIVRKSGARRQPGIRVHRTKTLEPRDLRRHRGIPVTSPARTLVDVASVVPEVAVRRAVSRALSLHFVSLGQLVEALQRLGTGRRGISKVRRIVASRPAPTRTELEDVVLEFLISSGLAHPHVSRPMVLDGRRVVPDFRWADQRLVIEADSAAWHDHKLAREDDAERQALLEAHGERVLRVTWGQVISEPERTLARIRRAGAPAAD
jgi:very-short-patch-repair endonuclease